MINIDNLDSEIQKLKDKKKNEQNFSEVIGEKDIEGNESIQNKRLVTKLKVVEDFMKSWTKCEKKNSKERHTILIVLCAVLVTQLALVNVLIYLKAFKLAPHISENFLKWFITEVFLQIVSIVFFIVKYLYNNSYDKIMKAVLSLIQNDVIKDDDEKNKDNKDISD